MYNNIINPINNKKYNIYSKKGINIINNYKRSLFSNKKTKSINNYKSILFGGRNTKSLKINKIVGINSHPFVLFYFKNVYNFYTKSYIKSILLIGEEHEFSKFKCLKKDKDCYNINQLQKSLFSYIDRMGCKLDVFIENYTKKTYDLNTKDIYESFIKTEESMLRSWENRFILKNNTQFYNFLQIRVNGETIPSYNNVFFHLIDLRYMFNKKLNLFVALNMLDKDVSKWFKYSKSNISSILYYILFNDKTKSKYKKGKLLLNKISNKIGDINKDFNNGTKINTYGFNEFIEKYKNLINIIILYYKNSNKFIHDFIKTVTKISMFFGTKYFFHTLDSMLMDLYTINKMFKDKKYNLMFYGGGWHSMIYCEFIIQHFKKKPTLQSKNKIFDQLITNDFKYECGL